tara:strand:+ start:16973 stop:18463 length:1491 start_codon:yes stop_codon:yes gene_type:complete
MKNKILAAAIKKFQPEAINISKTDVIGGALTSIVGTSTAQEQGAIDIFSDDNQERIKAIGVVGAGLVAGAVGAKGLKSATQIATRGKASRGQFREVGVSELRNNLQEDPFHKMAIPFYGGGKVMQGLSALTETLMGAGRSVKRFVDPRMSYASGESGIPQFFRNDLMVFKQMMKDSEDTIAKLGDPKNFEGGIDAYKKAVKKSLEPVNQATKVLHNKIINDYSNSVIFKGMPKKELEKYASEFVEEVSYKQLVDTDLLPKQAIDNLISIQGIKKGDPIRYLQLKNKGLYQGGDVLRGIQFDSRSAKWFESVNAGGTSPEKLFSNAKSIFGKNSVRKLDTGEIQIIFSPTRKGNIDWGGYAGTIVVDPKNPSHITMMADDLRDLFGVKLGETVLNVSPIKRISMPEVLKNVKINLKPTSTPTGKKYTPKKNVKVSDEMLDRVATRANMAKADINNLLELAEKYDNAFGNYKITPEFIASRLGAGAGITGVYALATED